MTSRDIFSVGFWKPCACFFRRSVRRRKAATERARSSSSDKRIRQRSACRGASRLRPWCVPAPAATFELALDAPDVRLGAASSSSSAARAAGSLGGKLLGGFLGLALGLLPRWRWRALLRPCAWRRPRAPCGRARPATRGACGFFFLALALFGFAHARESASARSRASFSSAVRVRSTTPERACGGVRGDAGFAGRQRPWAAPGTAAWSRAPDALLRGLSSPKRLRLVSTTTSWCGHGRSSASTRALFDRRPLERQRACRRCAGVRSCGLGIVRIRHALSSSLRPQPGLICLDPPHRREELFGKPPVGHGSMYHI